MNHNYYEPLGHLFLNIAEGQKLIKESDTWFRQALKSYEPMMSMFGKACNLNEPGKDSTDYMRPWEKTFESFEKSFRQSMRFFQVGPQDDYLAAIQRCESLEKTVAEQEQTIRNLNTLLGLKEDPVPSITSEIQDLLTKQQTEFQKLVNALGLFSQEIKKVSGTKKP